MTSYVISDEQLRRLSPAARRELLAILSDDLSDLRAEFEVRDWNPEGNQAYPLSLDEAELLIRGMPDPALRVLRVFAENYDGERGRADLDELLRSTGFEDYHELAEEFTWILLRLRSVTGNHDAWLFNWRTQDWVQDQETGTYTKGTYYVSGPAAKALRAAFGLGGPGPKPTA